MPENFIETVDDHNEINKIRYHIVDYSNNKKSIDWTINGCITYSDVSEFITKIIKADYFCVKKK